jgi:Protein of unknown function (DUF1488)
VADTDSLHGLQYVKGKDKVLLVRPPNGIVVDEITMWSQCDRRPERGFDCALHTFGVTQPSDPETLTSLDRRRRMTVADATTWTRRKNSHDRNSCELNWHRSLDYDELVRHRAFAMPLQRGDVQGYDFDRMVVEFTMLNQSKVILCPISTAATDDLEGRRDVQPEQRVHQFMKLRDVIEERASRKFFEEQAQAGRPVVLRSNDFFR